MNYVNRTAVEFDDILNLQHQCRDQLHTSSTKITIQFKLNSVYHVKYPAALSTK